MTRRTMGLVVYVLVLIAAACAAFAKGLLPDDVAPGVLLGLFVLVNMILRYDLPLSDRAKP